MIDQEKLKIMTQLALYEKKKGKRDFVVNSFDKDDFIRFQGLKTAVLVTMAFIAVAGLVVLWNMDMLINNFDVLDTSLVTNMNRMFIYLGYHSSSVDMSFVSNMDTSNVTNMNSMFYGCKKFPVGDLSPYDLTNVKDISYMFSGCTTIKSINLNSNFTTKLEKISYFVNSGEFAVMTYISSTDESISYVIS